MSMHQVIHNRDKNDVQNILDIIDSIFCRTIDNDDA